MAKLKPVVDSLEGLDESLHDLYEKSQDGAYVLQLEGRPRGFVPSTELDEFRSNNTILQRQLDETKTALGQFDGIEAEKARELLAKQEELDNKNLIKSGDIAGLVAKEVEKANKPLHDQIAALTTERDEAKVLADGAVVDSTFLRVAGEVGKLRNAKAGDTVVSSARAAGWRNVNGQLLQVDANGQVVGRDAKTWLGEQAAANGDLAFCFEPSTGGGGGGSDGDGLPAGGKRTVRRGDKEAIGKLIPEIAKGEVIVVDD